MRSKKKIMNNKNFIVKNSIGLVLYENIVLFPKILKKLKKYDIFSKKIRYLKARVIAKKSFDFKKRNFIFSAYLATKNKKIMPKVKAIQTLLFLAVKVKNIGKKILKIFSNKFVGDEARLLVKQYLNNYIAMYKFWYENEKWGFFDDNLTEQTKLKLMKYFWLNKPRRFLRSKIWKRAYPLNNFNFRYVKNFGYNIKSLKVTDQLFFWHAFTRKKLKQTLWIFRTSQIFRKILYFKKNNKRNLIKMYKYEKNNVNFFKMHSFLSNLRVFCISAKFSTKKLTVKLNNAIFKLQNLANTFFSLKNNKAYFGILFFLLFNFFKKQKNVVLEKMFFCFFVLNFFKAKIKTKKHLLSSYSNSILFSFFSKNSHKYNADV